MQDNKVFEIIKALLNKPNSECYDIYFQLGTFICSLLYNIKFKIDANITKYKLKKSDLSLNNYILIYNDNVVDEFNKDIFNFLHDSIYELTTQKDLLYNCENIYNISFLFISFLSIYKNIYNLQFISYIILRRIYFIFPEYRSNVEDILASVIINLFLFKHNKNYVKRF